MAKGDQILQSAGSVLLVDWPGPSAARRSTLTSSTPAGPSTNCPTSQPSPGRSARPRYGTSRAGTAREHPTPADAP